MVSQRAVNEEMENEGYLDKTPVYCIAENEGVDISAALSTLILIPYNPPLC